MNIGLVERDADDPQAAAKQLDSAQSIRRQLLAAGEASPKLQRDLAMGAYNQGLLEAKHRQADQAMKFFSEAIDRFHELVAQDPRDLNLQRLLALCYRKAADVQATPDAPGESLRFYELARDQFAKLADRNPDVTEYQSDLAGVYLNLAHVEEKQDPVAALSNADKSRSILADLVKQYPRDPQFRFNLAVSLGSLSILQFTAKQRDAAQDNMQAAIEYLKKLVEEYPDNQEYQKELEAIRQQWEKQLSDSSNVNAA
jgi:tetratricopeptide (TPR) repeat protein